MSRILGREGATPRVSCFFFKVVIQSVLIFGAETWTVTPRMGKALREFQTQVARRMTGNLPRSTTDRTWRYTSAAAAREAAGFLTVEEYFRRLQNTVAQYIATRSLLDLCERLDRAPWERVEILWWEQEGIDLEGGWEAEAVMAEEEGGEE